MWSYNRHYKLLYILSYNHSDNHRNMLCNILLCMSLYKNLNMFHSNYYYNL